MGSSQQFSLRWNNYLRHITSAFDSLRSDLDLVDVTLSCEGKKIKAHKMLLSACSTYFKDLFKVSTFRLLVVLLHFSVFRQSNLNFDNSQIFNYSCVIYVPGKPMSTPCDNFP